MEKAICCLIQDDDETENQTEADDDFHIEQQELKMQSSQTVLSIIDNLNTFCKIFGDAELVSALNLVN